MQVVRNHPQVPPEWKADATYERTFAIFYKEHVQKGSYKMNAEGGVRRLIYVFQHTVASRLLA